MIRRIVLAGLCFLCLNPVLKAEVKNPDRPENGRWDFAAREVWRTSGSEESPLSMIQRLKVRDSGQVYLFDYKLFKFFVIDPDSGAILETFGTKGKGPGEIDTLLDFFFVGDILAVYDMGRIHFFSIPDGHAYIRSVPLEDAFGNPPVHFLDETRFLTVPRNPMNPEPVPQVDIFDLEEQKGTPLIGGASEEPEKIEGISVGGGRMVFIGGGGSGQSQTRPAFLLHVQNGKLYHGVNDTYSLTVSDLTGRELSSFSIQGRKRKKISKDYKMRQAGSIRINGASVPKDVSDQIMKSIPDLATCFFRLYVDDRGWIYSFISDVDREDGCAFDIFSPEGVFAYKGELDVPEDYVIRAGGFLFDEENVYAAVESPEGELFLIKYRVALPGM